jgi:hypothetical protein
MRNFSVGEQMQRLSRVSESGGLRMTRVCQGAVRASRRELPLLSEGSTSDEVLIVDARAALRPAQLVERKLICLLKNVYLPVSHVRTTALGNGRGHFSAVSRPPGALSRKPSAASRPLSGAEC